MRRNYLPQLLLEERDALLEVRYLLAAPYLLSKCMAEAVTYCYQLTVHQFNCLHLVHLNLSLQRCYLLFQCLLHNLSTLNHLSQLLILFLVLDLFVKGRQLCQDYSLNLLERMKE